MINEQKKNTNEIRSEGHGTWVEELVSGGATMRDDRGIVRPDLLGMLSDDDKARLSECGRYLVVELWTHLHHPVTFEEIWATVTSEDGSVIAKMAGKMCAGCWAVLVNGIDNYEGLIGRITAGVLEATKTDGPISLSPPLHHAVMSYMDGMDPHMTVKQLIEHAKHSAPPLAMAPQRKVKQRRA